MRPWSLFQTASIVAAATASFPAAAQIYKCPINGSISLQQSPCPGLGQSGGELVVLPNGRKAPGAAAVPLTAVPREGRVIGRTPLPVPSVLRASK